jgi:AraC-like DNA-binding protein
MRTTASGTDRRPDQRSVSDLLSGVELSGQTWCYTDLGEHAGFSAPPGDAVWCHVVLHGALRLACAGGEMAQLCAGGVAIVVSGEAHALRTAAEAPAVTHPFLRDGNAIDVPPTVSIGAGRVAAHVLSGRLRANWPGGIDRAALPALLRAGEDAGHQAASPLLRPDGFAIAGMGAGSAALLTRIAELLLIAGLRADPRCRRIFAPARHDPIGEALRLIEGRPAASWTVERLARAVGMGRSNFAAHFTQEVGRAPMEVVADHRMRGAAALLREGRLKIAEIGESVGYGSEAAFSRRFTRHFGITPSQMREQARVAAREPDASPAAKRLLAGRMAKEAVGKFGAQAREKASAGRENARSLLLIGANRTGGGAKR